MPSLSSQDRVSLCRFTCYFHAQKEARAGAAETLGKDLAFFFSGDYLSANDLSTALARLIPAVVQGHVKPRAASTVVYLFQLSSKPSASLKTSTSTPSAPPAGAEPSAPPSKAISTTASRPTLNPNSPNHPNPVGAAASASLHPGPTSSLNNPGPTTRLTTR